MKIGEVCLLTENVPRLAGFYRQLLGVKPEPEQGQDDPFHQFVLTRETSLTIMRFNRDSMSQNMALAFTTGDIQAAHRKLQDMGAEIVEPPTKRPWGATNLSFRDPDGNLVYIRSFVEDL